MTPHAGEGNKRYYNALLLSFPSHRHLCRPMLHTRTQNTIWTLQITLHSVERPNRPIPAIPSLFVGYDLEFLTLERFFLFRLYILRGVGGGRWVMLRTRLQNTVRVLQRALYCSEGPDWAVPAVPAFFVGGDFRFLELESFIFHPLRQLFRMMHGAGFECAVWVLCAIISGLLTSSLSSEGVLTKGALYCAKWPDRSVPAVPAFFVACDLGLFEFEGCLSCCGEGFKIEGGHYNGLLRLLLCGVGVK